MFKIRLLPLTSNLLFAIAVAAACAIKINSSKFDTHDYEVYKTLYYTVEVLSHFTVADYHYNLGYYFLNVVGRHLGLPFEYFYLLYIFVPLSVFFIIGGAKNFLRSKRSFVICLGVLGIIFQSSYIDETFRQWPVILFGGVTLVHCLAGRYVKAVIWALFLSLFHYAVIVILLVGLFLKVSSARVNGFGLFLGGCLFLAAIVMFREALDIETRWLNYRFMNVEYYPGLLRHLVSLFWHAGVLWFLSTIVCEVRAQKFMLLLVLVLSAMSFFVYTASMRTFITLVLAFGMAWCCRSEVVMEQGLAKSSRGLLISRSWAMTFCFVIASFGRELVSINLAG